MNKRNLLFAFLVTVATVEIYSFQYHCSHLSVWVAPALGKLATWALTLCGAEVQTMTWTWFKVGDPSATTASTVLSTPRFALTISPACCGFISFFTLVAGAFFYSMLRLSKWRYRIRFMVFAAALAIFGNVYRVVSVFVVSWFWGSMTGMTYHDYSGYVVFIVEMALLFIASDKLKRRMYVDRSKSKDARSGRVALRLPMLVVALSAMVVIANEGGPAVVVSAFMQRLAVRLTDGVLVGPYAHFVASGIEAQAQTTLASNKWQIVAAAENVVGLASGTISNLTEQAQVNVPVMFVAPDIDTSATTSNIVIRPIRMHERIDPATGAHSLRRWYYLAEMPTVAPTIDSYVSASSNECVLLSATTNSFPVTETLDAAGEALPCVWYDFALPPEYWGLVLRPPEYVEFGGLDEQFEAAGLADADLNWVGATGEFEIDIMPGIVFQGEGGVTVGFRVKAGFEDNWVEEEGVWTYHE